MSCPSHAWTLPIPARFDIDLLGIIRAAESDPDYTTRPEPEDTLEAVRALSQQRWRLFLQRFHG
jgi:hypothetical protein